MLKHLKVSGKSDFILFFSFYIMTIFVIFRGNVKNDVKVSSKLICIYIYFVFRECFKLNALKSAH
jgi:hypothetical protein